MKEARTKSPLSGFSPVLFGRIRGAGAALVKVCSTRILQLAAWRGGGEGGSISKPVAAKMLSRRRAYLTVFVLDIIRQFPKHFHGSA